MMRFVMIPALLFVVMNGISQTVPTGITEAFVKGNAKQLAEYFHDNLEMKILKEEYVTSKNQASRIMQDFFKKNQPLSFHLEYEGTEKDTRYGLGTLVTRKGSFSVNLYFLDGSKKKIIYSMSIEKI
ncbi:MAG: DUF4783 domain-containing protein [Bacteroidales bacterium]|nr:DUF4783 domain-containing protein [Bacteroidales bacterium]MDT8431844.1 DUF4783 domain-containing protein [Bacteroidales bacterium]